MKTKYFVELSEEGEFAWQSILFDTQTAAIKFGNLLLDHTQYIEGMTFFLMAKHFTENGDCTDIDRLYPISEAECCYNCKHRPPEEIQSDGKFDCPRRPQSCGNLNSRQHYECWEEPDVTN